MEKLCLTKSQDAGLTAKKYRKKKDLAKDFEFTSEKELWGLLENRKEVKKGHRESLVFSFVVAMFVLIVSGFFTI